MSAPFKSDNQYYNIQITNNDYLHGSLFEARYNAEQTQVILDKPSDYYLTIARFAVPGTIIPVFYFRVQDNQANPNLGVYSVTLKYNPTGDNYQEYLIYVTGNPALPAPPNAIPVQKKDYYYFVYSYNEIVNFFNNAFFLAFAALKAAHPAIAATEAPYFVYKDEKISLIVPYTYIPGLDDIGVYFNVPTGILFNTYTTRFIGQNEPDGTNIQVSLYVNDNAYAKPGGTIPAPPANPQYLIYEPEYINYRMWSVLQTIVFTTTSLPINGEIQPATVDLANTNSGLAQFRAILTDFQPDLTLPGTNRSQLQYFPQGPYRLVDLTSDSPLRKIDLQVWWADRDNFLFPILVSYGDVLNVKLLFIRKDVYDKNTNNYNNFPQSITREGGNVQYKFAHLYNQ